MNSILARTILLVAKLLMRKGFRQPSLVIILFYTLLLSSLLLQMGLKTYANHWVANRDHIENAFSKVISNIQPLTSKEIKQINSSFHLALLSTSERALSVIWRYDYFLGILDIFLLIFIYILHVRKQPRSENKEINDTIY